ncbi:MAG: LPS-assembly protein LptD [Paludibacteraceae bacterium]|nr:LPS-assembly protein LptD [Paludibacteraceae bacterium]
MRPTLVKARHIALTLCCLLTGLTAAPAAENTVLPPDSVPAAAADTSLTAVPDTTAQSLPRRHRKQRNPRAIESDITYSAKDSIVMEGTEAAILYGAAEVHYQNITLKADYIRLRLDSSIVYATGTTDSLGNMTGEPVFSEGNDSYNAKAMNYNFRTKKGFIWGTVTQQGEGYVTSAKTKKISEDEFCLAGGKYTTCDQHDHPHFYLALTKAKMKQNHYIVTGPAYMVVADVPLPLAIPFGYFPVNNKYSSGILFPTFGEENIKGFYAKDFGYYFAINDYIDLALTADVYTKGSWGITASSSYKWRYKFSGSFNLSYIQSTYGERNTPDYRSSSDFSLRWSHNQDPKMSPYTTFSASVNFATSSYEHNNIDSYYNANLLSQNTKSSTITLTQKIGDSPFTLSASMYINQRTSDSTLNLSLPSLTLNMTRQYPFKRKVRVGKEKWYEKISISYNMNLGNSVTCKESEFLHTDFLRDWKNGIKHEFPISASFTLFKYINLTTTLSNNLKWYFSRVTQDWDETTRTVVSDTTHGFYNIYQGSLSVSMSTQLFGFYTLKSKSGKNMPVFRHKLVPTVSFSAAPDFGSPGWKYWDSYQRPANDGTMGTVWYDRFTGGIYGGSPSRGATGMLSFSIANNLEMKYWSKRDTTGKATKITLIDNFSFGSGYNFMADSLNWSNITANLRLRFFSKFSMNIDFVFDPYTYQLNEYGSPTRVNITQMKKNHILGRLRSTGTSFGYTFNNDTFKRKKNDDDKNPDSAKDEKSQLEQDLENTDPLRTNGDKTGIARAEAGDEGYQKFEMPWTLTFNYSIRYAYSDFNYDILEYNRKLTHNLTLSGSISFTKTWHMTMSAYYDITNNQWNYVNCGITKDLHCWQMSCSFVPVGRYKTYDFLISVKSTLLQDLKYERQNSNTDTISWF